MPDVKFQPAPPTNATTSTTTTTTTTTTSSSAASTTTEISNEVIHTVEDNFDQSLNRKNIEIVKDGK